MIRVRTFAELSGTLRADIEPTLDDFTKKGALEKLLTKNGAIWEIIK